MWVLLLPLGLGPALLPPGDPTEAVGGCSGCRSPHRGHAQVNGTLGGAVTLGCPGGGEHLGQLQAVHWHFGGSLVCSRGSGGPPNCPPPYRERAELGGPGGELLLLGGLRAGDGGTYRCLLLGSDDCACGEVTLELGGVPCSQPCSGAPPRGAFILLLLLLLLLLLPPALTLRL